VRRSPGEARGRGQLKGALWDAPSCSTQIAVGSRTGSLNIFYESLGLSIQRQPGAGAARSPSLKNGGVAKTGWRFTFKLKRGSVDDGKPFTAGDVSSTGSCGDPATGSPWFGVYKNVKQFEALDSHTVKCVFNPATRTGSPRYADSRHISTYKGQVAGGANNLNPVGRRRPVRRLQPGDL